MLADVKTGRPVHVEVEKTVYVTVPVGVKPPVKDARSVAEPPMTIVEGVTVEAIVGLALMTVRGSQALVAPLLLASPL
jgi:hypothetical protein